MIPLSLGYSKGRSSSVSSGDIVNLYPAINAPDAKSPLTLSECAGLKPWVKPGVVGEVRAIIKHLGSIYALVKNTFYKINQTTLDVLTIGTIETNTGSAWIIRNANNQIMIATNNQGYVYDGATFAKISDADFPGAASIAFIDNFGLAVKPDTGRLYNSDLNNFKSWADSAYVTDQTAPDNLLSVFVDHQDVITFGEETLGTFRNTGDVDAVFQPVGGGTQDVGINAPNSLAKISNVVFWIDNSLQVRGMEGGSSSVISTDAIYFAISRLSRTDDARGMAFTWHNHSFYLITFPTANRTFCYDLTASRAAGFHVWHERRSYPLDGINKWRGNCLYGGSVQDGKNVYVGDYENGWIYTLDEDTHTDNTENNQRIFTTAPVFDKEQRRNLCHHELELEVEMAVANSTAQDPQVFMVYSDDNGNTWSNELWASIGKAGEYKNRVKWTDLGESRNRVYKFTITDPVKVEVVGAYLRASLCAW